MSKKNYFFFVLFVSLHRLCELKKKRKEKENEKEKSMGRQAKIKGKPNERKLNELFGLINIKLSDRLLILYHYYYFGFHLVFHIEF